MNSRVKKILVVFSICLNIGFIIIFAHALIRHKMHPGHPPPFMKQMKIFEGLDLSPEQKTEIGLLVEKYIEKMGSIHKNARQEKLNYLKMMGDNTQPEPNVLDSQLEKIKKLEIEREDIKSHHLRRVSKVLTIDQANQFFGTLAQYKMRKNKP